MNTPKRYTPLIINGLALMILVFQSCSGETENIASETENVRDVVELTEEQYKNADIQLGALELRNISNSIKLNGKVDVPPQNLISVSVAMSGYLRSTKLLPGMQVKKGEVLAVLEDEQYIQLQQDYLTAKAQFIFSESEYKRQKELNDNKASSDKLFQQTKANFETQYAVLKGLEQKLKLIGINPITLTADNISRTIQVLSPVNGFVSSVNVNVGKYINSNDVMFELIDPDDIHLILTVYEKDIHGLELGQKVWAYSNSNPTQKYECEIILISRSIGNREAAEVNCHFVSQNHKLLPGTFMNAEVQMTNNMVQSLPEEAIVRFENKNYIFVQTEKMKFQIVHVDLGNSEFGFTEILNADQLNGKKIVLKGAYNLLMTLKNSSDE
jgi:cobalt-zinc-cadmium efflux system membrane fusion protein